MKKTILLLITLLLTATLLSGCVRPPRIVHLPTPDLPAGFPPIILPPIILP